MNQFPAVIAGLFVNQKISKNLYFNPLHLLIKPQSKGRTGRAERNLCKKQVVPRK
jgi:hypothetical protein